MVGVSSRVVLPSWFSVKVTNRPVSGSSRRSVPPFGTSYSVTTMFAASPVGLGSGCHWIGYGSGPRTRARYDTMSSL